MKKFMGTLLLGAVLLTGCTTPDTPVPTAKVALGSVGSVQITESMVDARVTEILTYTDAKAAYTDKAKLKTQVLSQLMSHEVLQQVGTLEGIRVSSEEVNEEKVKRLPTANYQEVIALSGIAPSDVNSTIKDVLLQQKLAVALGDPTFATPERISERYNADIAQYNQVAISHILVESETDARDILAKVQANPASFSEVAKTVSQDTSVQENGGSLGLLPGGALPKSVEDAAKSATDGTWLVVESEYGWHIVRVDGHKVETLEEATPEIKEKLLSENGSSKLSYKMQEESTKLGIWVDPKQGNWDSSTGQIVSSPTSQK